MKRFLLTILSNPFNLIEIIKFWVKNLISSKKTVVYNLHHDYFFDLFKDICTALLKKEIMVYFSYDSKNSSLKQYLKDCGIPAHGIISNKISPFVPFDMFITAEVTGPDFPLRLLKTKKVQMYHGTGVYNLYQKTAVLSRFDVHFAIGPKFNEFIENKCSLKNRKPVIYNTGYPKTDRIFLMPDLNLLKKYNPESKKVVLYAPHWNESGSLHKFGEELICSLTDLDVVILIKAHNYLYSKYSFDNWIERFNELEKKFRNVKFATEADTQALYPLSDMMITDTGTTAGFEFSLLLKPLIVYRNDKWFEGNEFAEVEKTILEAAFTFSDIKGMKEIVSQTIVSGNDSAAIVRQKKLQKEMTDKYLYNPGHATEQAVQAVLNELRER